MTIKKILLCLSVCLSGIPAFAQEKENETQHYGGNIISISPVAAVSDNVRGGAGVGISYERMLDRTAYLSLYVPMLVGIGDKTDNNGISKQYSTYYFMPGLKFYPTRNRGVIRYAIGASLFAAGGTFYNNGYNSYNNPTNTAEDQQYNVWGVMILNSLNICPTPHLYIGLEAGLGLAYANKYSNTDEDGIPLAEISFKIGFRF